MPIWLHYHVSGSLYSQFPWNSWQVSLARAAMFVWIQNSSSEMQLCSKTRVSQSPGLWICDETKVINSIRGFGEGVRIQIYLMLCLYGSLHSSLLNLKDIWNAFLHVLCFPVSCVCDLCSWYFALEARYLKEGGIQSCTLFIPWGSADIWKPRNVSICWAQPELPQLSNEQNLIETIPYSVKEQKNQDANSVHSKISQKWWIENYSGFGVF